MNETQINAIIGSLQKQVNEYSTKLAIAEGEIAVLQEKLKAATTEGTATEEQVNG